jgi:glutamate-5-semialdehyde dehydrogenase
MMGLGGILDVLIPRGNKGLIQSVRDNAKVPVIETGIGICHIYIDENADAGMALAIVENAKCSRPGICNAAECLLIHRSMLGLLPKLAANLEKYPVEFRACPETHPLLGDRAVAASEGDYDTEYLDFIIAVKAVGSLDEAMAHIAAHGSGHSEAILTPYYANARRFADCIDAAAVYVNASTRFTDGGEFGLGAEIGISTQKLHARGPLGLRALTTAKYVITGDGQVR